MSELVAVDWGTTSLRSYLIDNKGKILRRFSSSEGILSVEKKNFEPVLHAHLEKLGGTQGLPVICSGMITSRQGWRETIYVQCPATVKELSASLSVLDTGLCGRIFFVPGVNQLAPTPDIMRGEETQLVGISGKGRLVVILPGTHSKWVVMEDSTIMRFSTFMTGDVYQALIGHTILKALVDGDRDNQGFRAGVKKGAAAVREGKTLLSTLFQTRVLSLLEIDPSAGSRSYLSGLLIGTEIAEALKNITIEQSGVMLAGGRELTDRYSVALDELGVRCMVDPEDTAARGLFCIARECNLI